MQAVDSLCSQAAGDPRVPVVRSAAVLGAGVMGAQIAAHFANADVPVLLLDVTPEAARQGLDRARAAKPDPFFARDRLPLVRTGGFDDGLDRLATADWIVEAVVEQLEVKRQLLARVDGVRAPHAIVSSNTSGIPIAAIAEGRSESFRRHWLGTHFFNPPRYLRLLEVVPTADTSPDVLDGVMRFAEHRLGKGVVVARDTPNFIANHVALYGVLRIIEAVESGRVSIEDVDAITGPALGRPRSATFRTLDLAGLDILASVAANLYERLPEGEREAFRTPELLRQLVSRGWVGDKAGQGFYRREARDGRTEILALEPTSLTYRPRREPRFPSLEGARAIDSVRERVAALFSGDDPVGRFLRETLAPMLIYTARVTPAIAQSIDDVDRVMQWGFGWELGPFELFDAIGVGTVVEAWRASAGADTAVPPLFEAARVRGGFRDGPVPPAAPGLQLLRGARERQRVVRRNPGASLLDIGGSVLCVEFHSKMNAIGGDTLEMLRAAVAEAERGYAGLVVGSDATNFSAGANLMLLLLEAQEGNWDEIDLMVRSFQQTTMLLRTCGVPVVVAPAGLTLGGGCEIALHGDRVQAAAETYMGLVEAGVGLVPAGGGTKELLARAVENLPPRGDLLEPVQRVFETIGFARTSTSAHEARLLGYLRDVDGVTMNRERVLADARDRVLGLARAGYQPPRPRQAVRVGGDQVRASLALGVHLAHRAERISDHDALIGRKLAWILAGGDLPHETAVPEQYLLDLEREAFLSLCGEARTLERIQHTLKTGKPLRN